MQVGSLVTHYKKYTGQVGLVIASNKNETMNGRATRYTVQWSSGRWNSQGVFTRISDHPEINLWLLS